MSTLIAVMVIALAGVADAPAGVFVDGAGVPFSAGELHDAIALRVPPPLPDVWVGAGDVDGVVVLVVADVQREVDVRGLTGAPAARRVALAALDLVEPVRHVVAPLPGGALSSVELDIVPPPIVRDDWTSAEGATAPSARAVVDVCFRSGGFGTGVDATLALRVGPVDLVGGAGGTRAQFTSATLSSLPLRAGIGVRTAAGRVVFGARATAVLEPHWITVRAGDDVFTDTRVRPGLGGAIVLGLPIRGPLLATVTAGVDGYATSQRYQLDGVDLAAAARVSAWIGLGLSFGLGGDR